MKQRKSEEGEETAFILFLYKDKLLKNGVQEDGHVLSLVSPWDGLPRRVLASHRKEFKSEPE